MAGVLFIVCIPRAEHELVLKKKQNAVKIVTENCEKPSTRLINELKENKIFGNMKSSIDSFAKLNQAAVLSKCKSTECLSPKESRDTFDSESKPDLYKCKSEMTLSPENEKTSDCRQYVKLSWEEVKHVISPKKDKLRISTPEREPGVASAFDERTSLETILTEVLERLHVKDAVWCPAKENKYFQVFFSLESGTLSEEAIHLLGSFGIGTRYKSVVSVIPCALYYNANAQGKDRNIHALDDGNMLQDRHGASAWSRFVSSVRARTTLAQVVHDVRTEAALTFDWLFLLIVAAFVAAIGLVENSTVFLVASMLISPLMGPIMAGTVGTAVRDRSLQRMGVLHELFGLFLALVIGFIFGLAICAVDERYGVGDWPTYEMMSRCELRSLWVGLLVALPSGAGVALAVLGDYTASLVGVAISASLLPPAVNAGLLWAMALIHLIFLEDDTRWTTVVTTAVYSENPAAELAVHGTVSLCLTLVNILCIYIGGVAVYKVKEVAPIEPKNMRFWRSAEVPAEEEERPRSTRVSLRSQGALDLAAWDYFRWHSISERMRLARAAAGARQHDTWSPYTRPPPPHAAPRAQDIEAYCRRRATQCTSHLTHAASAYHTAGQGYTPLTSETSLASISEDLRTTSSAARHSTLTPGLAPLASGPPPPPLPVQSTGATGNKFKVTPAFDPHLQGP